MRYNVSLINFSKPKVAESFHTHSTSYSMKITERNPKNSNENEKRRQKVKSAKSAKMGKGNIFLNHRIMFSYKIPH